MKQRVSIRISPPVFLLLVSVYLATTKLLDWWTVLTIVLVVGWAKLSEKS